MWLYVVILIARYLLNYCNDDGKNCKNYNKTMLLIQIIYYLFQSLGWFFGKPKLSLDNNLIEKKNSAVVC